MIECKRTDDERFLNLPNYDFAAHYIDDLPGYEGLRVHYVDDGDAASEEVFLCLHGQPTWSYLYRKMIPVFTGAGGRVVAPDLLGFGKSDKPIDEEVYTFNFHRDLLIALILRLDLRNITLVCQDWGGILGLTIPPDMPERFSRLIVMNTGLPVGESLGEGFDAWKAFNASQPDMDIAGLMRRAVAGITEEEAAAYAAPFPDMSYKAGVRRFPELVMINPGMEGITQSRRAREFWSTHWHGKSFMGVGMQDPVLGPTHMQALRESIRGCPSPFEIEEGGHFVQEHAVELATAAIKAFAEQE